MKKLTPDRYRVPKFVPTKNGIIVLQIFIYEINFLSWYISCINYFNIFFKVDKILI